MSSSQQTDKRARRFAAAAILALAVCLVVPSFLFLNNTHSIGLSFGYLLVHAALWSTALIAVLFLLLTLAGRWWELSFVVAGLGLFVALKFLFLPTYVPLLDGTETFISLWTTKGMLSVLFGLGLLSACLVVAGFLPTGVLGMIAFVFLLIGLQPLLKPEHWTFSLPALSAEKSDFVKFSKTGDTAVFVIDTVQSDVALEVLEENPELAKAWVGFDYFWNHTGKAPTTLMSMLAIYGAREYAGGSISAQYRSLKTDSIFSDAEKAGYGLHFMGKTFFGCFLDKCMYSSALQRYSPFETSTYEYAQLIDIGLMRAMPRPAHAWWYNNSKGRIESLVSRKPTGVAEQSAAELRGLAQDLEVVDTQPHLKVVHVLGAHRPIVLNEKCRNVGKKRPTRKNYKAFVECSLRRFTEILTSLQKAGVYDQTTIVVMADHGTTIEPPDDKERKIFERALTYADRRGQFTPMFAVKLKDARHPFQLNNGPSETTDLRATLCAHVFKCPYEVPGADAFSLAGLADRKRGFIDFKMHQTDHRQLDGMPRDAYVRFEGTGVLREFDYRPELVRPRKDFVKTK